MVFSFFIINKLAGADFNTYYPLNIDQVTFKAQIALSSNEHEQGLQNRSSLPNDHGMMFIFNRPEFHGFWMVRTFIPLDIAFINESGQIIQILPLYPHDMSPVRPLKPILYALEMPQGWFKSHQIVAGSQLNLTLLNEAINDRLKSLK